MYSSALLDKLGGMSTIINNPRAEPERTVLVESGDQSGGWAVAVVVLLLVIAGGTYWYVHYHRAGTAAQTSGGTNINVTLPAAPSSGATGQ